MSRGRKLAPAIEFSTAGMSTRSRIFSPRAMIMEASASAVAAPPMSFFIFSMPLSGLMSSPPVSKQTPLPTSVTFGCLSSPQVRSISRGALVAARPTAWISGKFLVQQLFADHGVDGGGVARGELARGLFELRRPHVVCRRVDQIARQRHRFDDAGKVVAVEALRQIEFYRARLGLAITGEVIEAERDGKRGKPRIVRLVGEAVGARRQELRQPAGQKRILRFVRPFQPEQHATERAFAVLARQQE